MPAAVAHDPAKANAVIQDSPPQASSRRIRVATDVLELEISARGGDIIRADLLEQPQSIDTPEVPFRLLNNKEGTNFYVVQSGLLHDQDLWSR